MPPLPNDLFLSFPLGVLEPNRSFGGSGAPGHFRVKTLLAVNARSNLKLSNSSISPR